MAVLESLHFSFDVMDRSFKKKKSYTEFTSYPGMENYCLFYSDQKAWNDSHFLL